MKCHNCGTESQAGDKFCLHCGTQLKPSVSTTEEYPTSLPAEQAEKILNDARKMVRHLSTPEQVMGGAAVVAFISFFLPWYFSNLGIENGLYAAQNVNNWYYLIPLISLGSTVLLYFSQGSKHQAKLFLSSIQIAIGAFLFGMGIVTTSGYSQFGLWLFVLAAGVLTGASFSFQKKLVHA